MLEQINQMVAQVINPLADTVGNFNTTLQLQQLYNNYGQLSNNRFSNDRDYQKQLKAMAISYGGLNKIMNVVGRYKYGRN